MSINYTPDPNLDRVAQIASELGDRIRDEDPAALFGHLVDLCAHHPAKAAQLLMCLAAWFDPEEETSVLVARARDITTARVDRRVSA